MAVLQLQIDGRVNGQTSKLKVLDQVSHVIGTQTHLQKLRERWCNLLKKSLVFKSLLENR